MLKHIFCDLDGTLYSDRINEKDLMAIKLAKDNGIEFSIATGRVFGHAKKIIEETGINGYLICENGAYIYDKDSQLVYKGMMSDIQVKKVIDRYNKLDYIDKNKDIIYFKYGGEVIIPVKTTDASYFSRGYIYDETILTRDTYNSMVGNIGVLSYDMDKLKRIVEDLKMAFLNEFDIYISGEYTLNVVPKGISKFDAIKHVAKMEGISLDEIVTIGDSPNDISMLSNVNVSFAMENGMDIVKESAKFETPTVYDAVKMVIDLNEVEQEM